MLNKCSISNNAIRNISKLGFSDKYGARLLRRAIQSQIEDKLSEEILNNTIHSGQTIECDYTNNEFVFKIVHY